MPVISHIIFFICFYFILYILLFFTFSLFTFITNFQVIRTGKLFSSTNDFVNCEHISHLFSGFYYRLWTNKCLLGSGQINSFMTEVPTKKKPVHWFALQTMDWFLYDRDLHQQRVTDLSFRVLYAVLEAVVQNTCPDKFLISEGLIVFSGDL